ncbi:MAG: RdgB/HAM1 family non-canonical purine NTP pyrophosphatase [Candidatus Acidiferrales bacterium]
MTAERTHVYLASSNQGKLRELAALAQAQGLALQALPGYDRLPRFPESESSFALNALEKALHYSRHADGLVVADDSGIVVDALDGRPGVHSARYAGPTATDEDNNRKLLEELEAVPEEMRTARYVCVLALAQRDCVLALFSAACEGRLLKAPRGTGGFGYDPLFFVPPLGKTMAELDVAEKNMHSHRGKGFRKLLAWVRDSRLATSDL